MLALWCNKLWEKVFLHSWMKIHKWPNQLLKRRLLRHRQEKQRRRQESLLCEKRRSTVAVCQENWLTAKKKILLFAKSISLREILPEALQNRVEIGVSRPSCLFVERF